MKLDQQAAAKVPGAIRPNDEQMAILDADLNAQRMVIEAGAGTGKTSTLKMLGRNRPHAKMLYIAYNKAIQLEAEASFPGNVKCKTSHGLAYYPTAIPYKDRLNSGRMTARESARVLGIARPVVLADEMLGQVVIEPHKVAQLAIEGICGPRGFCASADAEVGPQHAPWFPGLQPEARSELLAVLLPLMQAAWKEAIRPGGRLKFTHDHYLKLFQLKSPRLPYDVILLDEAQDTTPCVASLVTSQTHAQIRLVGDSNQAIYEWRGAVDALAKFPADVRLPLMQSYRFGPELAAEANKWLRLLESKHEIRGWDQRSTVIDGEQADTAVICRTNGQVIAELMDQQERGRRVALVSAGQHDPRGTNQIEAMARAAEALQSGRGTDHPELVAFSTWGEVQQYVKEDPSGSDLGPFVQMVDKYGPRRILGATALVVPEKDADMVVSTAHKSKGREWDAVRIAPDFASKVSGDEQTRPSIHEMKLAYVAVTRAKLALTRGSLAIVDSL